MGWEFSVKVAVAMTYATVTLTVVPLATVVVTVVVTVLVVIVVTSGLFAFVTTVVEMPVAESVRVARLVAVTVIVLPCNRGETTRLAEMRTAPIRTAPTMYAVLLAPGLCGLVNPTDPWSPVERSAVNTYARDAPAWAEGPQEERYRRRGGPHGVTFRYCPASEGLS
jgi:hypothetical protein